LKKPSSAEERKILRFGFGPCNEDKMADDKNRVPLFDGTNFSNWKFRMEALLDEKDLLELVTELYSAKVVIQEKGKERSFGRASEKRQKVQVPDNTENCRQSSGICERCGDGV
jgi:hypothetical protein